MENLFENDAHTFTCRPYEKTWYGGSSHCISPSIARAIQTYERIMKRLSRSGEPDTKNQNNCKCNENAKCCCYRRRKQETARFVTLADACISAPNLFKQVDASYVRSMCSIHSHNKVNIPVPNYLPCEFCNVENKNVFHSTNTDTTDDFCNCVCFDNQNQQTDLNSNPSKLCVACEPTCILPECSVENDLAAKLDEVEKDQNPMKNININIEVKVKKKKKHKVRTNCKCKRKSNVPDDKINVNQQCNVKLLKQCSVQRKCMCVATEPITIIDLQPQKKGKFKFLKFFQFCKKDKTDSTNNQIPKGNIFVHTSKPLEVNELSKIMEENENVVRAPPTYTARKQSENEDDISVIKIKDVLKRQSPRKTSDESDHPPRMPDDSIKNYFENNSKTNSIKRGTKKREIPTENATVEVFPSSKNSNKPKRRSSRQNSMIKIYKDSDRPKTTEALENFPSNSDGNKFEDIPSKQISLRHTPDNSGTKDKLLMNHVDSREVNRQRASKLNATDSNSSLRGNTTHLSKRSSRNSKTRNNKVIERSEHTLTIYHRLNDWLISSIQANCMIFGISTDNLVDTKKMKCSYHLYIGIISYHLNKSYNTEKYFDYQNNHDFSKLDEFKTTENNYIPMGLRTEQIYRVNLRNNKFLVNKGRLQISYSGFITFMVTFIHILYFIIFVYFTFL